MAMHERVPLTDAELLKRIAEIDEFKDSWKANARSPGKGSLQIYS